MMRLMTALAMAAFVLTLSPACSETEEEAPAAESALPTEDEQKEGEGEEEETDDKAKEEAKEQPAEPSDEEAEAEPDEEVAPKAPEVTPEECAKACAKASELSLKSLPPEATDEMKKIIAQALDSQCPGKCLKHGTKAKIACVLAAKTAMDLAACPK